MYVLLNDFYFCSYFHLWYNIFGSFHGGNDSFVWIDGFIWFRCYLQFHDLYIVNPQLQDSRDSVLWGKIFSWAKDFFLFSFLRIMNCYIMFWLNTWVLCFLRYPIDGTDLDLKNRLKSQMEYIFFLINKCTPVGQCTASAGSTIVVFMSYFINKNKDPLSFRRITKINLAKLKWLSQKKKNSVY